MDRAADQGTGEIATTNAEAWAGDRANADHPDIAWRIGTSGSSGGGVGVVAIMNSLPDKQQEVLRLRFQGGLSYQEIGHVMDLTVSHVGVLLHTAIKTIRDRLGNPAA